MCPGEKPWAVPRFKNGERDDLCFAQIGDLPSTGVSCGGKICENQEGLIMIYY